MSFYRGTENLTEVSAKQWDYITQENLTAREAVAFLYSGMQTRTFRDVLRQVCPDAEQSDRLTEGLCAINPDAQPDSIRRKVQNWMGGKALPTQREDVFQICFALGLDLEQSDRMLGLLTGEALEGRADLLHGICGGGIPAAECAQGQEDRPLHRCAEAGKKILAQPPELCKLVFIKTTADNQRDMEAVVFRAIFKSIDVLGVYPQLAIPPLDPAQEIL